MLHVVWLVSSQRTSGLVGLNMASITAPVPAKSILGFRGPSSTGAGIPAITVLEIGFKVPPPPPSNFRIKDAIRLRVKQRLPIVFASNNPSGADSVEEKSDAIETRDSAQGPPFLTILAGLVVLFLVFWILGSIIMWLVGLIVNLPPSK